MKNELQSLLESFNSLQADMRNTLDAQSSEIKQYGESTEATGKKIDVLDNQLTDIQAALNDRIEKAENAIARGMGAAGDEESSSVGEMFASSDQYKEMISGRGYNSKPMEIRSFFGDRLRNDISTAEFPSRGLRVPGIVAPQDRDLRIRDLLDVASTTDGSIEYVEETGFTINAATVAERALKPESGLDFELRSVPIRTIAHWIRATRQVVADERQLANYIDNRLTYGLKVVEDAQLLYGTGGGTDLFGLMTNPRVQTYDSTADGEAGDTRIDAVRRAMTLVALAEYPVSGVVLHPKDWEKIETAKGSDGHYLWVNVTIGGERRLWRAPVVETPAINEGEFLTGAFSLAATLWDREQSNVRIAEQHGDFFIRNMVVILAEERVALTNYRPEAFVNGSF